MQLLVLWLPPAVLHPAPQYCQAPLMLLLAIIIAICHHCQLPVDCCFTLFILF